jgi:hypothetical protein
MLLLRLCLFGLLSLQWLRADCAAPVFLEGEPPVWVVNKTFNSEPNPYHFLEVNVQHLLFDQQQNWEEQTTYFHFVAKALTKVGGKMLSQVKIDFHPQYEKVIVHAIDVWRENRLLKRLSSTRQQLLQRELSLESNIYYGSETLVYFLEDLRAGDIVEYAYSVVGEHPFAASSYADVFYLQSTLPVNQIHRRLLIDPSREFEKKTFNSSLEPQVREGTHWQEWTWEITHPVPCFMEYNQPSWHFPIGCVQLSQYRSWGEVAQKYLPLFTLPKDLMQNPGSEMEGLISQWYQETSSEEERALRALRFVQDELWYFGFEEEMNSFQPVDPRIVLHRRYGDCKDKTFLLQALLSLMGIPSTPVLVNLYRSESLLELLPTPFAFNHIILQIELNGTHYWVDPTWTQQGGSLLTNAFPDFGWGLPLSRRTYELVRMPALRLDPPIEIQSKFKILSEDNAEITIKRVFYGAKADIIRNYLNWVGHLYLSASFFEQLEQIYGKVSLLSQSLEDNREENRVTLIDSYHVATQKKEGQKILKIRPLIPNVYLPKDFSPNRFSPLAITYPLWVKETIQIENPFSHWDLSFESNDKNHESLYYHRSLKKQGQMATLDLELQFLKDHVPVSGLEQFWLLTEEIDQDALFALQIVPAKKTTFDPLGFFEIPLWKLSN